MSDSTEAEPRVVQCANPACRKTISNVRDGQTLEFEIISVSVPASDDEPKGWDESPKRAATRVYLCSQCAPTVSIQIGSQGITILPSRQAD